MRGIIILGNGFEDTEALATIDVLKRSKIIVDIATVNDDLEVESQYSLHLKANLLLKEANYSDYDFLLIPGGKAVFTVLDKSNLVSDAIQSFVNDHKLVAAICAAPYLVGKLGYFKDHSFTCFPGAEKNISLGKYLPNKKVIREDNFITAKAMAYSLDFALEIIEYLQGKEQRKLVSNSIHGEL